MCAQCITSGLAMPPNLQKCSALRIRAFVNKFIQAHMDFWQSGDRTENSVHSDTCTRASLNQLTIPLNLQYSTDHVKHYWTVLSWTAIHSLSWTAIYSLSWTAIYLLSLTSTNKPGPHTPTHNLYHSTNSHAHYPPHYSKLGNYDIHTLF